MSASTFPLQDRQNDLVDSLVQAVVTAGFLSRATCPVMNASTKRWL